MVDSNGEFKGLLTHRDLLRAQADAFRDGTEDTHLPAAGYMTTDVTTVEPETPADDAARVMLEHRYGCLPVVDSAGQLLGIVTERDFLQVAAELLENVRWDGKKKK